MTNGEPRPVAELIAALCRAAGVPEPTRHVPVGLARASGIVVESLWTLTQSVSPGRQDDEPPLTRFLVEQLSTAHWFDQRLARQVLQWQPRVSLDEGLSLMIGPPNENPFFCGMGSPAGSEIAGHCRYTI